MTVSGSNVQLAPGGVMKVVRTTVVLAISFAIFAVDL